MIYIVTSGDCSDYSINAVFQDRNKAKVYCECHPDTEIEEWEFYDDNIYTPFNVVHIYMNIRSKDENWISFSFQTLSKEDDNCYMVNKDCVNVYGTHRIEINLIRMLPNNYNEEKIRNKYTKVFHDLIPEIKYIISDIRLDGEWGGNRYKQRKYAEHIIEDFIAGKFGIETDSV